jgi:hypothetical protein
VLISPHELVHWMRQYGLERQSCRGNLH